MNLVLCQHLLLLHLELHTSSVISLLKELWGSDQMASIEPAGLLKLVKGIRDMEKAFGSGNDRIILKGELEKLKSLRG